MAIDLPDGAASSVTAGDGNRLLSQPRPATFRWVICALLFWATTINYIDRQILSLIKPLLDGELGWSNAQFGLVNSLFQGAYALSLLGFGWFIGRFGARLGYVVSIAAWSLAAAAHALTGSIAGFATARIALGLGEGGNFPAAITVVAQWFAPAERPFATTVFNAGANVGALIAPATIPLLAEAFGWRSTFLFAGMAGFVWLACWLALYRRPGGPERPAEPDVAIPRADAVPVPWLPLTRTRAAWAFIVAKLLTDPIWWFFLIWLPDYLGKIHHLNLKSVGWPLAAIYALVTVLSLAGGYAGKVLAARGWSLTATRKLTLLLCALAVLPVALVPTMGLWGAVALIGLAGGAHQTWSATLMTTVSDLFPQRAVAAVIGMGGMAGAFGGMCFPIVTGWLLDRAAGAQTGYAILFGGCSLAYLLAFFVHHRLLPRFVAEA